ncbi:hypothetical protein LINGRAHAP2_LOCUS16205 [Linum grandiflorum]
MLDRDASIKVEHIYREGNWIVDYLTGIGHKLPLVINFSC